MSEDLFSAYVVDLSGPIPPRQYVDAWPYASRAAVGAVPVRGEPLHPVLWRGAQWAVTDYGLETLDGTYAIDVERLLGDEYLIRHMGRKLWVDVDDFTTAFCVAVTLHARPDIRKTLARREVRQP